MIILKDYGVELHQLTIDKIELVRQWRNASKIQQYMEYRQEITPDMQKMWFDKINSSDNNFYFLIQIEGKDIGMINIKNIDWFKREGESGIFIWDDSWLHTGVSYRSALCQRDFAFNVLHLDKLYAHIYNTNIRSIKYNYRFGFQLVDNEEANSCIPTNQLYILQRDTYLRNKKDVIDFINKRYGAHI